MDCSTRGFPVHHPLLELAQLHVCRVSDAIQPSHPLSSPSPPALDFPSIRVFSSEIPHAVTKTRHSKKKKKQQREHHVKIKAEMGVMQLQGRDHPEQPANVQEPAGAWSRLHLEPLKGPDRPTP